MRKSNRASVIFAVTLAFAFTAPSAHPQKQVANDVRWKELDQAGAKALAEGRPIDAEKNWKSALQLAERFGPDDGRLTISLNNLAEFYQNEGKYTEAEPLRKRALALMEKILGPEHPLVVQGLYSLATLYWAQGKYADAEPLSKKSLAIVEKVLGPDNADVAASLNNLATLYQVQGKYGDAEPLHRRSLAILEQVLGPEHPKLAINLTNLAAVYEAQGKHADAEGLYKRILTISEKSLDPDLLTWRRAWKTTLRSYERAIGSRRQKNWRSEQKRFGPSGRKLLRDIANGPRPIRPRRRNSQQASGERAA
jgi:tetratricopeptide (TPR) repeat protein